jgi:beta-N-acetylhexosaminidase
MLTMRRRGLAAVALMLIVALAAPSGGQTTAPDESDTRIEDRGSGRARAHAWLVMARMSLREKVGQLFWTRAYGGHAHDTSFATQNQADYGVDTAADVVEKYKLGGVLYFAWPATPTTRSRRQR